MTQKVDMEFIYFLRNIINSIASQARDDAEYILDRFYNDPNFMRPDLDLYNVLRHQVEFQDDYAHVERIAGFPVIEIAELFEDYGVEDAYELPWGDSEDNVVGMLWDVYTWYLHYYLTINDELGRVLAELNKPEYDESYLTNRWRS